MFVEAEGIGRVEFPDDATQDEISSALNKSYPAKGKDKRPTEPPLDQGPYRGYFPGSPGFEEHRAEAAETMLPTAVDKLLGAAGKGLVALGDVPTRLANRSRSPDDKLPLLDESPRPQIPRIKSDHAAAGAANTVIDFINQTVPPFAPPEAGLLLPLAGARPVAALYGASTAGHLPEEVSKAIDVLQDPKSSNADRVAAVLNPAVQTFFAGAMLRHGVSEPRPRTGPMQGPIATGEVLKTPKGATPPPPEPTPETITAAAYQPKPGQVETGANHPEILKSLGVTGFDTPESRNTPEFGFQTSTRPFITREEAGDVAKKSGQALKDFDPGEPVHSNEVAAPGNTETPLSESKVEAKPISPHDIEPALLVNGKPVTGGANHNEVRDNALKGASDEDSLAIMEASNNDAQHVFVTKDGTILTREQAGKALGLDHPLQSEELAGLRKPTAIKPPAAEKRTSTTNKAKTLEEKKFNATAAGQKIMASRASRIGTLHLMNESIRKIDPNEAYDRGLIDQLPDSQIDQWMEDLRQTWNRLKSSPTQPPTAAAKVQEQALTQTEQSYKEAVQELSKVSDQYEKDKYNPSKELKSRKKYQAAKQKVLDIQQILLKDKPESEANQYLESILSGTQPKEPIAPGVGEGQTGKQPHPIPEPVGPGMGGAIPQEFTRSPDTATSIKNATVDSERAKRGLPPAMQPAKRSFGEVWDRAMALVDKDPKIQDALIAELRDKPRALTDLEDALLLHRQIDLQNEYGKATRDLAQAFDDGREDDVARLKLRVSDWSDQLQDIYDIGKKAGTETGRGLNARKMLAAEDYSLVKMEMDLRAANGGRPLTDTERSEVTKLQKQLAETQKRFDDYVAKNDSVKANAALNEAFARLKAEQAKLPPPLIIRTAEKIVATLDKKADAARQRIRERMGRTSAGVDPTILLDLAEIGASHIGHIGLDFVKWSDAMLRDMGDWVKPHLDEVFKRSQQAIDSLANVPEKVKRVVKKATPEQEQSDTVSKIQDLASKGQKDKLTWHVQKLARMFLEEGGEGRENMVDFVHDLIKDAVPDLTRRQTMDMISGYGDFKQLTKDAISVRLRGYKGELQQLAKLEDMANRQPPKKTGVERREITEAERQLIKRVNDAKLKFQIPISDPATQLKSALDTLKTTLRNRIADYEDRMARNDLAPKERRTVQLDREALKLKADVEAIKRRFDAKVIAARLADRSWWEKGMDFLALWRRSGVLSSPVVIPKLLSAGVQRLTFGAVEDIVSGAYSKLPVYSKIAERAPTEGGGTSLEREVAGWSKALTTGRKQAWKVLKEGRSDLDAIYGKPRADYTGEFPIETKILGFWGRLHGMLKTPVKEAAFERAQRRLGEFYARQGLDLTDELVQVRIAKEAYEYANRAIFLQDNALSSKVNRFIRSWEEKSKVTGRVPLAGKAAATAARVALPIMKVPVNIAAETLQYATGLFSGNYRMAQAFRRGIETLRPEEADLVMRDLKKGSIGAAVLLLGYLNPDTVGGYYQPGKKRDPEDVKAGAIRIYGHNIPSYLLHNPLLETLQLGATIRRVSDSYLRRSDEKPQGLGAGVMAGALGLSEQIPFVREELELEKLRNPYTRGKFLSEQAKSIAIPRIISWSAEQLDRDPQTGEPVQRAPGDLLDTMKTGLPGLRQQVQEK